LPLLLTLFSANASAHGDAGHSLEADQHDERVAPLVDRLIGVARVAVRRPHHAVEMRSL
jgi:hypothetical protein